MVKLYYCPVCRRVEKDPSKCSFCEHDNVKQLKVGSPVNVIGSKQKGRVLKINENEVKLIVVDQANQKQIKSYQYDELRKVL